MMTPGVRGPTSELAGGDGVQRVGALSVVHREGVGGTCTGPYHAGGGVLLWVVPLVIGVRLHERLLILHNTSHPLTDHHSP